MKTGVAALAGLLLLACSAPALATSSSVIIGYYQSFDLTVQPASGNLCAVGGVPTQYGITGPTTGQTIIAFTEGTGVHYMPINASAGYTAYDAVLSPDPNLKIDTTNGALSLVFNSSAASVNEVASVTLVLVDQYNNYNCSATITYTVVSAPTCTAPPAPGSIAPYPAGTTYIQNPRVPTTVINNVVNIINVQYNINVQTTTNNYYSYACACCFNSCNNYIVVTPPAAAPVLAPPVAKTAPPPPAATPSPAPAPVTPPPPPAVVNVPPAPVPVPAPSVAPPPPAPGSVADANAAAAANSI